MRSLLVLGALLVSVSAGAETPSEQFRAGQAAYQANCVLCHGETGRGGQGYANPIWGRGAQIPKFGTAAGLLDYHLMMMPFDDPTRLDDPTKVAITLYVLAQHGTLPSSATLDPAQAASVPITASTAAATPTTSPASTVQTATPTPGSAPPATPVAVAAPVAAPTAADMAAGETVFRRRCAVCHSTAETSGAMIGANLRGVMGRRAGSVAGARYSEAMRNSGLVWDEETLTRFLAAPAQVVPRTTMVFPGLRDHGEVAPLLSYLRAVSRP
ncbi:MAG: hypothetical protein EAZ99_06915 [Alphaproteobacteria bacterium]|nr:MAG: hypothetical protein EAZ99_06915 [Alphaproteobacteria bacterium]